MDSMQADGDGQAGLWNGDAGHAWVEEQAVIEEMFRPIEAMLAAAVRADEGVRILDVGCGTGATTLALARRLGPGARCLGVDIAEPMVAAARRRAAQEAVAADFLCADAQRHPFAPGGADWIVSRFGVMFFDDPVAAFANLRRAARAGGQLCFVAWRGPEENPFMTAAERAARPLLPDLPPRLPDEAGQFGFARAAHVRDVLEQAGWEAVRIEPVDVACSFAEAALPRYLARMGPVGRALAARDAAYRERVLALVRPAFAPWVGAGRVAFTAACWRVSAQAGRAGRAGRAGCAARAPQASGM